MVEKKVPWEEIPLDGVLLVLLSSNKFQGLFILAKETLIREQKDDPNISSLGDLQGWRGKAGCQRPSLRGCAVSALQRQMESDI